MNPWKRPDGIRRNCYFYDRRNHRVARVNYRRCKDFAAANPDWELYSFQYISAQERIPYCMCELWCWWAWKKDQDVNGFLCDLFDFEEYGRVLREER